MKKLSTLDASWLLTESKETPMHVANLAIFSLPKNAPENFVRELVARAKASKDVVAPWNYKLRGGLIGKAIPAWVEDHDIDMDYHFRHSALPVPGGERELGILVSRLHSHQLDFSRPPWECHLIEGLEGNRVALYTKMHHSLVDGVSGARMLTRIFSPDPTAQLPAPWSVVTPTKERTPKSGNEAVPSPFEAIKAAFQSQAKSTGALIEALRRLSRARRSQSKTLIAPFAAPKSILNGRVKSQRRFATQQYDLAEIKAIAKAGNCSLNDVVLYLCATSMRRFLKEANNLPARTLTTGIPVNVRPADDLSMGNAISFMMANLATDVADPLKRLATIKASTAKAKEHLQSLPKSALTQYTSLVMAPYMLELITGLGGRMTPVFNITISNVPGPEQTLYYNGAKLEAMYPVSLIAHGGALNITCLSYAGTLNFGFTGCRDSLPHMQRLAVYMGDALDEIKTLLLPPVAKAKAAKASKAE